MLPSGRFSGFCCPYLAALELDLWQSRKTEGHIKNDNKPEAASEGPSQTPPRLCLRGKPRR